MNNGPLPFLGQQRPPQPGLSLGDFISMRVALAETHEKKPTSEISATIKHLDSLIQTIITDIHINKGITQ